MNLPKLKVRPRSTHTVFRFGGLMHNDEAPVGMTNGTTMRWYDERNLGHDKAPMMAVKAPSTSAVSLDGNVGYARIIGWCEGEHLVLLDELGVMWCNGNTLDLLQLLFPVQGDAYLTVNAEITTDEPLWTVSISDQEDLVNLCYSLQERQAGYLKRRTAIIKREYDEDNDLYYWTYNGAVLANLGSVGISWTPEPGAPDTTGTITIQFVPVYASPMHRMVRMGAYVVDATILAYVNVEDLAAGNTMTLNENYGSLNARQSTQLGVGDQIVLTLCRIDGTPYTGAVASATEPSTHTHVWIDTSGDKNAVVREWSESTKTWIVIPSTYVKISGIHVASMSTLESGVIRTGDGVRFETENLNSLVEDKIRTLLNSSHVIVEAKDEGLGSGYVIVPGVMNVSTFSLTTALADAFTILREAPDMDFVVEAQNRLWGCKYGPSDDGTLLNEIYASTLGDPRNWSVYEGLSTDSWTASRGTPAPFTGAASLSGHPLFFREESLEKVYPSSTGAHQIQTYTLDGVEEGSDQSLVIIDERLYYKSRLGVCVYDGTMPRLISGAFGNLKFTDGSAGRHKKQYVISMTASDGERIAANYDTATGEWHLETYGWHGPEITWKDKLYVSGNVYASQRYIDTTGFYWMPWYAESGVIGYELAEHRFISCVRIRMKKHLNSIVKVYIRYQDTDWQKKAEITGDAFTGTREINIFPRRCDHFRIRLEGAGPCEILSMSFRMERSEGGH